MMTDPAGDNQGRNHVGWLAAQVEAFVEHDAFPEWMEQTMQSIAEAASKRRRLENRGAGNVVPTPVPLVVVVGLGATAP
ncbi:MAG: hypothetical protein GY772_19845 [bacterium]|nr:hypothetical protein [bacterium]